jgi:hypothetical protein
MAVILNKTTMKIITLPVQEILTLAGDQQIQVGKFQVEPFT